MQGINIIIFHAELTIPKICKSIMGCVILPFLCAIRTHNVKKNILGVIDLRVAKIYALIPA